MGRWVDGYRSSQRITGAVEDAVYSRGGSRTEKIMAILEDGKRSVNI